MKKIIALFTFLLISVVLVACNKNTTQNTNDGKLDKISTNAEGEEVLEGRLDIICYDLGFGTKWIEDLCAGFEAKYPDVTINLKTTKFIDKVHMYLQSAKSNPYDIIFNETSLVFRYAETEYSVAGYECCFENLYDVYTAIPKGETLALKDKLYEGLYDYYKTNDEEVYAIPTASTLYGLMYNTDLISEDELPNTTNELVELCKDVEKRNKNVNAIVYTKDAEYFDNIFEIWWAQYEGVENWKSYFKSTDIECLKQTGRLKSLEVLSSLIDYEDGYADPDSPGLEFIPAQQRLMEGKAAIYPCGTWIENEMSEFFASGTAPVDYMKTPVISSIVEKLEYRNGESYMTDEMLSAIIDAIDSGETSYTGVSDKDFNKIKEARGIYYYENMIDSAVIPAWSDAKTLAKKFLIYMYSDEGVKLHTSANTGGSIPVYYDHTEDVKSVSSMQKQRLLTLGTKQTYIFRPRHGSIMSINFYKTDIQISLGGKSNTMSPQDMIDYTYNYYNANNRQQWILLGGK